MYKIWDSVYKIVQNYDPVFYVEITFEGAACHQPPKFQLPIAQEGMVYTIWDSVYKIVQNKYKIMIYFSFSKSVLVGGGLVTCTFFWGVDQTPIKKKSSWRILWDF